MRPAISPPSRARPQLPLVLTAAAALWLIPAIAAAAPADESSRSDPEPLQVELVVVVDLPPDDSEIQGIIREKVVSALESASVSVESGVDAQLVVDIRWVEGSSTDYAISIRLGQGSSAPTTIHDYRCDGCTAPQLLTQLGEKVADVVPPKLAERSPAPAADSALPAAAPEPAASPAPSPQRRSKASTNGIYNAGLFFLPVGAGVLGGSLGGFIFDKAIDAPVKPFEWGILGAGVGLTAIGATLVGVAYARDSKKKRSARLTPTAGGLVLTGRF